MPNFTRSLSTFNRKSTRIATNRKSARKAADNRKATHEQANQQANDLLDRYSDFMIEHSDLLRNSPHRAGDIDADEQLDMESPVMVDFADAGLDEVTNASSRGEWVESISFSSLDDVTESSTSSHEDSDAKEGDETHYTRLPTSDIDSDRDSSGPEDYHIRAFEAELAAAGIELPSRNLDVLFDADEVISHLPALPKAMMGPRTTEQLYRWMQVSGIVEMVLKGRVRGLYDDEGQISSVTLLGIQRPGSGVAAGDEVRSGSLLERRAGVIRRLVASSEDEEVGDEQASADDMQGILEISIGDRLVPQIDSPVEPQGYTFFDTTQNRQVGYTALNVLMNDVQQRWEGDDLTDDEGLSESELKGPANSPASMKSDASISFEGLQGSVTRLTSHDAEFLDGEFSEDESAELKGPAKSPTSMTSDASISFEGLYGSVTRLALHNPDFLDGEFSEDESIDFPGCRGEVLELVHRRRNLLDDEFSDLDDDLVEHPVLGGDWIHCEEECDGAGCPRADSPVIETFEGC
ncbi:hypothetical protein M011DRAFT_455462 [Sporormia fimetaria CBS 119925]|uniref:Uncharacterized protein n=1 Tax=Sporormia fimetaria CBS 119925 TaxID=1340428 RepID=A0A6A6VNY5_9PLEO|nr:hypothetical protein M011DRAFT_455462 [Sporormia fimetaria CBS 119925]